MMDTKAAHTKLVEAIAAAIPAHLPNYPTLRQLEARDTHCGSIIKAVSDYLEYLTADLSSSTTARLPIDESDVVGRLSDLRSDITAAHQAAAHDHMELAS